MRTNQDRRGMSLARRSAAGFAAAAIAAAAAACSTEGGSAACSTDSDCTAGERCVDGACAQGSGGGSGGGGSGGGNGGGGSCACTHHADCGGPGDFVICHACACVSLVNDLCTTVYGTNEDAYLDDSAVFFGSILPTVGVDSDFGVAIEDGIRLAIDDFAGAGGIPSPTGGPNRPLVLVGCNDGDNEDRGAEAAKHLVSLGVPAIVGHAYSGATIQIATEVTIPAGVLLFTPSGTSEVLGQIDDTDLVWSAAPSDADQGEAIGAYGQDVEGMVRARYPMIAGAPIRVALVRESDVYSQSIADRLVPLLVVNGQPATAQAGTGFEIFDAASAGFAASINAFAPHVVIVTTLLDGPGTIMTWVEAAWAPQADGHRPMWVLTDAARITSLWEQAVTTEDLRTRVTGTSIGVSQNDLPHQEFVAEWEASHPGRPLSYGVDGAYDILYLLAYSAVAVGAEPLTGARIAQRGLRRMLPGPGVAEVSLGPPGIPGAIAQLAAGQPIDVMGVSGKLDFDASGIPRNDVQIWCLPNGSGASVAGPPIESGRYYDATAGQMAGAIGVGCGFP